MPLISDHCSITIALRSKYILNFKNEEYDILPKPGKIMWSKDISNKFENIIQSEQAKLFLKNFGKNGILSEQKSVDKSTEFLTEFLVKAALSASNNGLAITSKAQPRDGTKNWKFRKKITERQ